MDIIQPKEGFHMFNSVNREISKIIVHSSNSDLGTFASLEKLHKEKGMDEIGYHFVIERNGHIEKGRKVAHVGEHCVGHNLDSIGICLIGKEDFTSDQLISLGNILQALLTNYPTIQKVHTHAQLAEDGCWFVSSSWFDKPTQLIQ